jgi:hypothetical protein
MTGGLLEQYRHEDPALSAERSWEMAEPLIRDRIGHRVTVTGPDTAAGPATRGSVRRVMVACAVGALLATALLVSSIRSAPDAPMDAVRSPATTSDGSSSGSRALVGVPLAVRGSLIDSRVAELSTAINAGDLTPALDVLSFESDCDWPMLPDVAIETCAQFWGHEIALGGTIEVSECTGDGRRRCTITMSSRLAKISGHAGHRAIGRIELALDDRGHLVFEWAVAPAGIHLPGDHAEHLYRRAANLSAPGDDPADAISASDGPYRLDHRSAQLLMEAASALARPVVADGGA